MSLRLDWGRKGLDGKMYCERPACDHQEYRIDGYCSIYCRDIHELELEVESLRQLLNRAHGRGKGRLSADPLRRRTLEE